MPFKIKFCMDDYKDILPPIPDDDTDILNMDKEIPDQKWSKQPFPLIITRDFIIQEATRIKQGVWILIKGELIWIPGNYYFFLQYWNAAGQPPKFRLKRLKLVYKKLWVRKHPQFIGTLVIKNRKDGETLFSVCDGMWEVLIEEQKHGAIAMQSKTRDTVVGSCWKSLVSGWNGIPMFFKDSFFSDFESGKNIAEQLKFQRAANPNDPNDLGKNINILYGPCVYNAFDAYADIIRLILDEIFKWLECSASMAITNYGKIIMPGNERRGLFDCFSSPPDSAGKHVEEGCDTWRRSNPRILNKETNSTFSRLLGYYSNPLEGIEGFYDEYGDADPQQIFEHIHRERRSKSKDDLMGEVRAFPLPIIGTDEANEEELFGSTETHSIFINMPGIIKQKDIVITDKANRVEYGNLVWPQNIAYEGMPIWVKADRMEFDEIEARFCMTETEESKIELRDIRIPPDYVEECLGIDPFNLRYQTKNKVTGSMGAALSWKFRDLMNTGKNEYPTLAYLARPSHGEIFYEDMIKAAVYRRAMVQYENSNDKMENYFEDNGFLKWMIPSTDAKPVLIEGEWKIRRGDAPSGKGATAFLNEGINLINGITNKPLLPGEPYWLENFNIAEALDDLIKFNRENTQFNHFTMAFIQALLGKNKLKFSKKNKSSSLNNQMIGSLLD